ncbi:hypothetical protein Pan44_19210 [Caulifigura coniformis]|uniref:Uncharacterized protein n=1 Tax=Caulifigura coniformis TaxID=2527983 RepID=A0A517SCQ8_9PLAN|nr:hypothetical protein [Caulifigura coniformis]QDT53895.1 hypothetical protein Pan44_19210 [Caulifigura coniformis]
MPNDRPVHEIRLGKCKAVVWGNSTEQGTRYNVTFARLYKQDDRWESTSSFGRDDLPLVEKLADQAFTWIHGRLASDREEASQDNSRNSERRSNRPERTAARSAR